MQKKTKHSKETREKMRAVAFSRDNTNRIKALPRGDKHWNFKENTSVLALHKRLHRKYGPAKNHLCEFCGEIAKDWALISKSHTGKREDYKTLCRKCHMKLDKPWEKIDRSKFEIIRDNMGRFKDIVPKIIT